VRCVAEIKATRATDAGRAFCFPPEYALMNGWSVKAEYLYVDLGSVSTTSTNLTTLIPPLAFPASVFTPGLAGQESS